MTKRPHPRDVASFQRTAAALATDDAARVALRVAARLLIEGKERAERAEAEATASARARGLDFDSRIQYAQGSAAAYAMACSILAGAAGVPNIEEMAGADWRQREPAPPTLPTDDYGDTPHQFAPGDRIAAASVIRGRTRG